MRRRGEHMNKHFKNEHRIILINKLMKMMIVIIGIAIISVLAIAIITENNSDFNDNAIYFGLSILVITCTIFVLLILLKRYYFKHIFLSRYIDQLNLNQSQFPSLNSLSYQSRNKDKNVVITTNEVTQINFFPLTFDRVMHYDFFSGTLDRRSFSSSKVSLAGHYQVSRHQKSKVKIKGTWIKIEIENPDNFELMIIDHENYNNQDYLKKYSKVYSCNEKLNRTHVMITNNLQQFSSYFDESLSNAYEQIVHTESVEIYSTSLKNSNELRESLSKLNQTMKYKVFFALKQNTLHFFITNQSKTIPLLMREEILLDTALQVTNRIIPFVELLTKKLI